MAGNISKNISNRGIECLNVGNPGNKGGTGRPKSVIREKCAGSFEQRIKVAEEILDDPSSTNADKIRALDLLGKYAGLQQTDITTNDQAVKPVVLDVSNLGMELIDEILAKENMHTE